MNQRKYQISLKKKAKAWCQKTPRCSSHRTQKSSLLPLVKMVPLWTQTALGGRPRRREGEVRYLTEKKEGAGKLTLLCVLRHRRIR